MPTTRVADGADVVHPPPILRVPPIALNAARIDSPRARRPLVVTPQDVSSLEPIVAWLRAGIPPGDGDGDGEDFPRKKSVVVGELSLSPPAAVTAAGFATRGAFAAAVLHTAREACAGVLRASSARLNAHTTAGLASRAGARSPVESATEERLADGAPDAERDPGGSPVPRAFSVSRANPVHETPPSRHTSVADIADESQFPSLGGARRRLDAPSSSNANAYGEFAESSFVRKSRSTGVSSTDGLDARQTRRPTVPTKPPKRIQPTSTKLSLDAAGPNPRTGAARGDERDDASAESHERLVIVTPRRVAAVPAVREGEPPATPGSAVAAPPLRRTDASASPGGSQVVLGSQGVVSASLFPASSADAEAEAEAETLFFERRNAEEKDSADDVRRTKPDATVSVATFFSLSTPLVSLAVLHGAAIGAGVLPDLAPEMAFLCDVLATPLDVVRVDAERSGGENVARGDDSTEKNKLKLVIDSGSVARRYAALVLSRSERAPHASGEKALGALCASAALRRHAPALHASLVRELGAMRRREGDGEVSGDGDGDGTRGETFSCSFAAASTEGASPARGSPTRRPSG